MPVGITCVFPEGGCRTSDYKRSCPSQSRYVRARWTPSRICCEPFRSMVRISIPSRDAQSLGAAFRADTFEPR